MALDLKLDMKGLKLNKLDPKMVVGFLKDHLGMAFSAAVVILVAVGAPLAAMEIEAATAEEAAAHAAKMADLAELERVSVSFPGANGMPETQNTLLNQKLIDAYEAQIGKLSQDSLAVRKAALEFNRKGRGCAFDFRAAEASPSLSRQMHLDAFDAYKREWGSLFTTAKVAEAPRIEEVIDHLKRRRSAFVTGQFKKSDGDPLTDDEKSRLAAELARARLERYFEAAAAIRIYGEPAALGLPTTAPTKPDAASLFEYQWRYWVVEDILAAIASVNGGSPPTAAAVKRIDAIKFLGAANNAPAPDASGAAPPEGADATALPGAPIDPRIKVSMDQYGQAFTGRSSNQLYDVYLVDVRLVMETAKIPSVLDAIAKQNFMTVLVARVQPEDSFAAADDGYMFGSAPCSSVRLLIESVWLREWTAQFMPDAVRKRIGTSGVIADQQGGAAPTG